MIGCRPARALQSYVTPSFRFMGPAIAMCQGMSVRADNKMYADILRLVDFNLATIRRKNEHRSPGAARGACARYLALGFSNFQPNYMIWIGPRYRLARFDFPQVNEYLDATVIPVLRTAFEIYKRDDLLTDLIGHYRRQTEAAPTATDAIYPRLALSSFLWWNDDKDEAIAELTKVVDASRAESDLRLDLAGLLEKQGAYTDALTLVDARQPLDNFACGDAKELALRVALVSGDVERARQAAERLFGLRLDTETQISLAGQMQQLGLHELADAVLGRARRRAGNRATALVGLMLQYQRQQKPDQAVQIAMQILRSTSTSRQSNANANVSLLDEGPDPARSAALTVLARSGQLPRLIERANLELKKIPNSILVHQALADYYTAARDQAKARGELETISRLRPDDASLRLRVGEQMMRDGQATEAIVQFKAAFKKDPSLLTRASLLQIQTALLNAGKADGLLELLEAVDLRNLAAPLLSRLIESLPLDARLGDRVVSLFRRAWAAFPQQRFYFIAYVKRDDVWQMPEIYDYAREAIIPRDRSSAASAPWIPFVPQSVVASQRAKPSVVLFVDLASKLGKLDGLASEIVAARKKLPAWTAGDALLAMVLCRAGRIARLKSWSGSFPRQSNGIRSRLPVPICFTPTQRSLKGSNKTRRPESWPRGSTSTRLMPLIRSSNSGSNAARRRSGDWLTCVGEKDALRTLAALRSLARDLKFPDGYREELANTYKMQALDCIARELMGLGFAADAVPLLIEGVNLAEAIDPNSVPPAVAALEVMQTPAQIRQHLNAAIQGLDTTLLAPLAGRLIAETIEVINTNKDATPSQRSRLRDQALDMVLMVYPRELESATLRSLLAESIAACDARQLAALDLPLESLRKAHPDDLSVAIARALGPWPALTRNGPNRTSVDCFSCWIKHHSSRCRAERGPMRDNAPWPRG